eukprot:gene6820-10985_t
MFNKSEAIEILETNPTLKKLSKEQLYNYDFMYYAIKKYGAAELLGWQFQHLPDYLKQDSEIIKYYAKTFGIKLKDIPTSWTKEEFKKSCFSIIVQNPRSIEDAPDFIKDDEEIMEICIHESPELLQFASERLKNDKKFVLKTLQIDKGINLSDYILCTRVPLKFASKRLRNDREVIIESIKSNYLNLQYASAEFTMNKEFLSECMRTNGHCYDINHVYKNDEDICMAAVSENGLVIAEMPTNIQMNEKIAFEAVKKSGYAYFILYQKIGHKADFFKKFDFCMATVESYPEAIIYNEFYQRDNREIAMTACSKDGTLLNSYRWRSTKINFCDDEEIVMVAVKQNGLALEQASARLKQNRKIVYQAVKQNGDALKYSIGFENDVIITMLSEKMYFKLITDMKMERLFDVNFSFLN